MADNSLTRLPLAGQLGVSVFLAALICGLFYYFWYSEALDKQRQKETRLADLQNQHGILERDVRIIDLRLPDQVVLRRAHPAVPEDQDAPAGDKPKDKAT